VTSRQGRDIYRRPSVKVRALLIVTGLAAGAALVLWSPLLMYRLLGEQMPWARLADAGEAYGGISAFLSGAALCGIGASLIVQSRQMRQELTSLDKQRHFDLIKLALDNPELLEVVGVSRSPTRADRQMIFANLMMNYWLAMWELGEIGEAELRNLTAEMFRNGTSRSWWRQQDGKWQTVRTRRRRYFMRVVHEEWSRVAKVDGRGEEPLSSRPVTSLVNDAERTSVSRGSALWATVVVSGFVGAVMARRILRQRPTCCSSRRRPGCLP
jgi:hypothetical protein